MSEVQIVRMHLLDKPLTDGTRTTPAEFEAAFRGMFFKGCRLTHTDERGWYATTPTLRDNRHCNIRFTDAALQKDFSEAAIAAYEALRARRAKDDESSGLMRVLGVDPAVAETLDRAGL